jgi:hypothetical protein
VDVVRCRRFSNEKEGSMNSPGKLTPKQEKMARIIADLFEMSDMSTAEACHVLECLIEVTSRSQLTGGNGPRLGKSVGLA